MAPKILKRSYSPLLRRRKVLVPQLPAPLIEPAQPPPGSGLLQISHNNYEIQSQLLLSNRPALPERDRSTGTMLVILASGDQRLVNFPFPRESCTVHDLLVRAGVRFNHNTTIIQCVEHSRDSIDFVVRVGFSVSRLLSELVAAAREPPRHSPVEQISANNYAIHSQHVLSNRAGQAIAERNRNLAKMLVIQANGQKRLITFTLPRVSCTVKDLLERVGVPFESTTTIKCVEHREANVDFVVGVGFHANESASELISRAEESLEANDYSSMTLYPEL